MANLPTSIPVAAPATAEAVAMRPRYRHPGDVIGLICSGVVAVVALGACALWGTLLLGPRAAVVTGAEPDTAVGRLLVGLVQTIAVLAPPAAVAALLLVRRYRLLVSLIGAAGLAAAACSAAIHLSAADRPANLVANRAVVPWIDSAAFPSAPLVAGAVAAAVVAGPWLNPSWRRVVRFALGLLAGAQLVAGVALAMELVLAVAIGWLVGAGALVAFGAPDRRIDSEGIKAALEVAGVAVRHLRPAAEAGKGSRPFVATLPDGQQLFVKVLGRDQRYADLLYRGYRLARLRGVGDTRPAASLKNAVEHQALGAVMAERAGVHVPHVHRVVEAPDGSVMLTMDFVAGHSMEGSRAEDVTDEQLQQLWREVECLHRAGVAHRSLRTANVMVDASDRPWIVDFSFSEVAATERQLALDRAELLASTAVLVGPDRAASTASVIGNGQLASAVPLLQPLALSNGTRRAVRAHGDVLSRTRSAAAVACSAPPQELPDLHRVRPRTLMMIAAAAGAFYFLLPQLAQVGSSWRAFQSINWAWVPVILAMSLMTYVASAIAMTGTVPPRLPLGPTLLTQWASSFVNRVSPANVGGMALNVRYLQKCGVDPASAAAAVGLNSLAGGMVHAVLLVAFVAWSGTKSTEAFTLPFGSTLPIALALFAALVGAVLATGWGRRTVLARLIAGLRSAAGDLRRVARSPAKLFRLFAGSAGVTLAYIGAVAASVSAFGGGISLAQVGTVYLASAAIAAAAPTPGGLGPLEAALVAGLTGVGMAAGPAVSAVLVHRLATYWLPILPGWVSWQLLQRWGYV